MTPPATLLRALGAGSGWATWRRHDRSDVCTHASERHARLAGDLGVRRGAGPRDGRLVVVRLRDGVVAVKRATGRRDGGWWVERDNPAEGVDSWLVGAIPEPDVVAVVQVRVWPLVRRGRGGAAAHRYHRLDVPDP